MPVDVLAIGAHPDDAELGCAGFLLKAKARGLTTGIVCLTRGEMSVFGDPETRAAEAEAAARVLGVDTFQLLDQPDALLEPSTENALRVVRLLRELRPRLVLTPHCDDHHPDHVVVCRLVERAIYLATRAHLLPELEILVPSPRHLTFPLSVKRIVRPTLVLDITDVYSIKREAIECHRSQSALVLYAAEVGARSFGAMIGVAYGEGFLHTEPLPLTPDLGIV